jgi:hypothetical protein
MIANTTDTNWQLLSIKRPTGKVLIVGFFLLPVLDNLSGAGLGFLGLTASFLLRMLVLVFFFFVASEFHYSAVPKLLGIIVVLLLPIFVRFVIDGEQSHLTGDIIRLLKTLYGIFGMYTVYALLRRGELDEDQLTVAVAVSALVYCAIIGAAFVLNFGFSSYGGGRGTSGFIHAANDVSHSIAISVPFIYWFATRRVRNIVFRAAILGMTAAALLLLFTKSGLLGLAVLVWLIYRGSPKRMRFRLTVLAASVLFYVIASIIAEKGIVYDLVTVYRFLYEEYGLLGLLFRGRQDVFHLFPDLYNGLSIPELLFGKGFTGFSKEYAELSTYWVRKLKNSEMDLFDLFFSHGIAGTGVILWFYLKYSRYAFLKTAAGVDLRYSLLIFWIHSMFAGHAMSTPIVGTYIAAILGLGFYFRSGSDAKT